MSPPKYKDQCRLVDTICPGSLDQFESQVTKRGPDSAAHFSDVQNSLAWPNAVLTHLSIIGEMIACPETRHSTVVLQPIRSTKTGTLVVLRSLWIADGEAIEKRVVSHFLRTGPGQLVKAKEPPFVCLENSLAFEGNTRDTIRRNKAAWTLAGDSIVRTMETHGFVDPSTGSINANGRVFSAGPGTRRVIVYFDISPADNPFVSHNDAQLVRWPFPRDESIDYIPNFGLPDSSTDSSITWRRS